MKRFPIFLACVFSVIVAWSAYKPAGQGVWWMEMAWVLGAFLLLALTYRRFRFSNLAYGVVFIWLVMHTIGAHYTFENVPFDWFNALLGSTRNNYDRVAHFGIGLNACLFAELFIRKGWVRSRAAAAIFGILAIMAMAAAWEIIEWGVAVWDGGDDGLAFLGSQGDVWDAQKDMLCDTLGAILGATVFYFVKGCKEMTEVI